ncbi:Cys-tRNA(Pro)/Cys-tRNA(Cys) deacylase YbaK [Methylobacterium cerastii]|uniref:Cys-tRNA(Pro)/Cys-tRNA(Cys) deacylase n=1 Tax=Methylobacterium cerastii TaxID=932741 RepID=A0ABQ4QKK0_9HYPH|nr:MULTISPECIES: aminoacyl-tRNA deacylase [Methylobacterium]TXN02713.1 aminoacyl-tRNA deacylase [Methylobacterium sp. WL122]TXN81196.1 aminoacyl-tRNA deacylase [Methylobacterium sp. WL8]GJD45778.1 Cys-tRNA(Pro)/Cys-tRNA(Cys) deacylase YbaK [Methylobacterium cerastii]
MAKATPRATPASRALDKAGIAYAMVAYAYDAEAPRIGLQAADALGVEPGCILKTLMAAVDGQPVCLLVASDKEVAMKRVASAMGGKAAAMLKPPEAERITGYHVGGISPFGAKRRVPVLIDEGSLADRPEIHVNGGGRGLQLRLATTDLVAALQAQVVVLAEQ